MNAENRERNARAELDRARTCLEEAEALRAAGYPYGVASRAYFAAYHAAQALLFSVGLEARTHRDVVALVGEHFVRAGALSAEMGRLVSRMQRDREDADYVAGAVFTDEEARQMIADARAFLAEVERIVGGESPQSAS